MKKRFVITDLIGNVVLCLIVLAIAVTGFYGSTSNVFSKEEYQAYYKGNTSSNYVSLMINVYWGTEYIEPMLAIFKKYEFKTTFFIGGQWASQNSEVLSKIANDGHEIGNHGYYHKDYSAMSYENSRQDMMTNHALIEKLTGIKCTLFAPPSGAYSNNTLKCAYDNNYKTIMWSRDTIDWRDKDSKLVYNRATNNISGGELVLMHPTAHTLKALEDILKYYKANGFVVVPVSQNIAQ